MPPRHASRRYAPPPRSRRAIRSPARHSRPVASGSALARRRRTLAALRCDRPRDHRRFTIGDRHARRLHRRRLGFAAAPPCSTATNRSAPSWSKAAASSRAPPDTCGDDTDRSAALTMIACPFRHPIRSRRTSSRTRPDRLHNRCKRSFPPRSSGWALTLLLTTLKSRLYGGAASTCTPHAPEGAKLF